MFRNLAKIIAKLPRIIMSGYADNEHRLGRFGLYPFYLLLKPWCEFVIPLFFHYLDALDKNRGWTIGYLCICRKTTTTPSIVSFTTDMGHNG